MSHYGELCLQVVTIAVLVILITAPIGAAAIALSAPRLLRKDARVELSGETEGDHQEETAHLA